MSMDGFGGLSKVSGSLLVVDKGKDLHCGLNVIFNCSNLNLYASYLNYKYNIWASKFHGSS